MISIQIWVCTYLTILYIHIIYTILYRYIIYYTLYIIYDIYIYYTLLYIYTWVYSIHRTWVFQEMVVTRFLSSMPPVDIHSLIHIKIHRNSLVTLWLFNIAIGIDGPFIDGLPFLKMGGFSMANC